MSRQVKIIPIAQTQIESIFIAATHDKRKFKSSNTYPIAIRVTWKNDRCYFSTGITASEEDYDRIRRATNKGAFSDAKKNILATFDRVVNRAKAFVMEGDFSFDKLKDSLNSNQVADGINLLDYWTSFGESKKANKTKEQYRQAARSFYRAMGCTVVTEQSKTDPSRKVTYIKGAKTKLMASQVTAAQISKWEDFMDDKGLTAASKSMYLRAFRAVMNSLSEANLLKERPKIIIKAGGRRKEDFLPVSDIVKIRDYQGHSKKYADWWIIIYLCNGSNLKDLANLRWGDDYFYSKELTYIRAKIAEKVKVTVHIPVTEFLQTLLDTYASKPKSGELVFPQILLDAKTEDQKDSRVHDFNRLIRQGMQTVCANLGIRPATASTARNSYITTLTWHGISDAFIDSMVGHTDSKNVLRGYQGTISPKKRAKINNLLFTDPETEDDE